MRESLRSEIPDTAPYTEWLANRLLHRDGSSVLRGNVLEGRPNLRSSPRGGVKGTTSARARA
jgi:hypothetical protein